MQVICETVRATFTLAILAMLLKIAVEVVPKIIRWLMAIAPKVLPWVHLVLLLGALIELFIKAMTLISII